MTSGAFAERVWVGDTFRLHRIFVLGESWYGDFPDHLVTDHGYISAYLEGTVKDALYSRIANATGQARSVFWHSIMFTNFVQCVGATRQHRPTVSQYTAAQHRLARLLEKHAPAAVWILGVGQSEYSAPIVRDAGIAYEISPHPTSYGVRSATLNAAWTSLVQKCGTTP